MLKKSSLQTSICCKFHQHFTGAIFVGKQIEQLFSSYIGFVIFWQKNIGEKGVRKMLMKLTIGQILTGSFLM